MTKHIVIVGNAPLARDLSKVIDGADIVIRFNGGSIDGNRSGRRTDFIYLNNSGKPMQTMLADTRLTERPVFRDARQIILAYHPDVIRSYLVKPNPLSWLRGRRRDWTFDTLRRFGTAGKEVLALSKPFYEETSRAIGIDPSNMRRQFPSTGLIGVRHQLAARDATATISICGFSWEGWKRHAWDKERAFMQARLQSGELQRLE